MTTPDEMRAMAERLTKLGYARMELTSDPCLAAAALLRSIAEEREAEAQQEYDAGRAHEEYGSAEEGACLYGLYAENRQFASQEPPRRNERGGWDY